MGLSMVPRLIPMPMLECSVCLCNIHSPQQLADDVLIKLFGAKKYAVCCCCNQLYRGGTTSREIKAYKKRWDKWREKQKREERKMPDNKTVLIKNRSKWGEVPVTVGELKEAIKDLPEDMVVLIEGENGLDISFGLSVHTNHKKEKGLLVEA